MKDFFDAKYPPASELQEIHMPLHTKQECIASWMTMNSTVGTGDYYWQMHFCGGGRDFKDGTACYYDSGSPLVCKDANNDTFQYGITLGIHGPQIRRRPCTPGIQDVIYLRVSSYIDWIEQTTKNN